MEKEIQIIHEPSEHEPFVIVNKPSGLPSAPLTEEDRENCFYKTSIIFPQLLQVSGKKSIEHGLLHRLDTITEGLLIIAANQSWYDYLLQQQNEGKIEKSYSAVCNLNPENAQQLTGFPEFPLTKAIKNCSNFEISSYFRHFGKGSKEVRPVTAESNKAALNKVGQQKEYCTKVFIKQMDGKIVKAECRIVNGFKHQVRCHLAWAGLPIINDPVYNSSYISHKSIEDDKICFKASGLAFTGPDGKEFSFTI